MTSATSSTSRKPGRRAETPQQRLERLQRDLEAAKQQVKAHRQRAHAALGAALIEEARMQPDVMQMLRDVVARRIAAKPVQADVTALLNAPS